MEIRTAKRVRDLGSIMTPWVRWGRSEIVPASELAAQIARFARGV